MLSIPRNQINADDSHIIQEREEVGFFFLKDAIVTIPSERPSDTTSSSIFNRSVHDEWIDVDIKDEIEEDAVSMEVGKKKDDEQNSPMKADPLHTKICPRCNVVLYTNEENNQMEYKVTKQSFFNGLMRDSTRCDWCMHVDTCTNSSKSNESKDTKRRKKTVKKQRTDAALLLGTILQCKNQDFLRIEKFQILLSGEWYAGDDSDNANVKEDSQNFKQSKEKAIQINYGCSQTKSQCIEVRCSILVTVSLPLLETVSKSIVSKTSQEKMKISDVQYDDFLTTQSRGFAPFCQLAFSLIRSDWSWLESTMLYLKDINKRILESETKAQYEGKPNDSTSVFPPSLSLEHLYHRIRGASTKQISSPTKFRLHRHHTSSNQNSENIDLLTLPEDVLISNIAPYLRAKSLHKLRMTCKYLNHILRSVVPGMKLKLYPHQVRSLQWMRLREMRCVHDDDAMQTGCDNSVYSDNTLCGDLFRSISAGTIVCVAPRRTKIGTKRPFWHINSWTGGCSLHYRNERMRTVAKCRSVARGGLLCDDPGMGKTITLLSCILQTFGQSTEKSSIKAQKKQITDDIIVDSYWRENLVRSTRYDELYSLCSQIRKCGSSQYFQYPVEDYLSKEEYKCYCSIIKDPICMEDIMNKMKEDKYSESIADFARDVRSIYK